MIGLFAALALTAAEPPLAQPASPEEAFPLQGLDWSRYDVPYREYLPRFCANWTTRTVVGRVARKGRELQERPLRWIGFIPFGIVDHRGTLVTDEGEKISVTWLREWGDSGDPAKLDPLDDQVHRFEMGRLAGARSWILQSWDGVPENAGQGEVVTAENCHTLLSERGPRLRRLRGYWFRNAG